MIVALGVLGADVATACPACASGQSSTRWGYLVLVILPFVVLGLASRAIYVALRD